MTSTGLILRNTASPPTYNEPFWELRIHSLEEMTTDSYSSNPNESFSLASIWNFNSRKDTKYQTMFAQVGTPLYCWVPESDIMNTDSELFLRYKELLILNEIRFVDFVDGYYWVVNDDKISSFVDKFEGSKLPASVGLEASGSSA